MREREGGEGERRWGSEKVAERGGEMRWEEVIEREG